MSKSITESGRVLHRANCDCNVCRDLRDDTCCEQCDGPVLVVESDLVYARVCQHCGARGTMTKAYFSEE